MEVILEFILINFISNAYISYVQNIENDEFWTDGFPPVSEPKWLFEDNPFDDEKIIR